MTSHDEVMHRTSPSSFPFKAHLTAAGLALLGSLGPAGCAEEPGSEAFYGTDFFRDAFAVEVSVHDLMPTAAFVSWPWDDRELDEAWVEVVSEAGVATRFRAEATDEGYSCALAGLKPQTEYGVVAWLEDDDAHYESEAAQLATGGPPLEIPSAELTVTADVEPFEGVLVTSILSTVSAAVILDHDGDLVWWHSLEDDISLVPRARLARDGQSVLYMWSTFPDEAGPMLSEIVHVSLYGDLLGRFPFEGAHHDFVELPDRTVAALVIDQRIGPEGEEIIGDAIVEWNRQRDEYKVVWSSWDTLPLPPSDGGPGEGVGAEWTHANALDYDEARNTYSVSLCNLGAIVTIDRATGKIVRQVGGEGSDFDLDSSDGHFFEMQHQFQFVEDRLLVFDNGFPEDASSRVVEFRLDEDLGSAKIEWFHTTSPSLYCPVQGDVNRFADDSTLITWSTAGRQEVVSDSGAITWQLDLELGAGFGYTTLIAGADGLGS